jgi:ribosomal protein L7/L12
MELPADAENADHANRNIEAIKLLREQRNLGLKQAKEIVDAYIKENRYLAGDQRSGRESGGF